MNQGPSSVDMLVVSVFERELTFLDTMRVNPDTPDLLKTAAPATYAVIRDHLNNRLRALKRD